MSGGHHDAEPPRSGLLAQPPENAGLIDDGGCGVPTRPLLGGLQGAVTKEIEKFDARVLDSKIRALAPDDFRRTAYLNLNATSRVWLAVLPDYDNALTNAEFAEVSARYFGAPSPACAAVKGLRFGRGPKTVDEYGFVVSAEASVPGGGWTSQHDRIKRAMAESAREMGQEVAMEVYGLFAAHIPQHGRAAMRELSTRTRHGLVPDFMMWIRLGRDPVKQYLLELKCAHLSPTWYATSSPGTRQNRGGCRWRRRNRPDRALGSSNSISPGDTAAASQSKTRTSRPGPVCSRSRRRTRA